MIIDTKLIGDTAAIISSFANCEIAEGFEGYLKLGLSPLSLKAYERCIAAIEEDGIMERPFAKSWVARRCIYFLYGKNYCGLLSREERTQKIKELLNIESGNFSRLKSFALSAAQDCPLLNEHAVDRYVELCITHDKFLRQEGAVGGFPQMPFFRFQGSACGYIASACSWYSIKMQTDIPDQEPNSTLDVAHYVRRNLFSADADIDERVIENKGGYSFGLAKDLTGRSHLHWTSFAPFAVVAAKQTVRLGEHCLFNLQTLGPGLVTNFHCSDSFKQAGQNEQDGPGYWLFDGDDPECDGVFNPYTVEDGDKDKEEEYRNFFESQNCRASFERDERKKQVHKILRSDQSSSANPPDTADSGDADDSGADAGDVAADVGSSSCHSMVMLSGVLLNIKGKKKHHFMLLNWWSTMPLVVVSAEYLNACAATVRFLQQPLFKEDVVFAQTKGCMVECSLPNDGGDVTDENGTWDEFGHPID